MSANADTAATTGRNKTARGKERSDASQGHASQNTSSPEGATESDNIRAVLNDGKNRNLWPLPKTWSWSTVGQLTEVIRGASPRPKGDPRYFGGDVPWIMIADVTRQPGKYLYKTREGVTEAGAALSRKIAAGELILSNSATVCVPKILKVDGCIHDGFVAFPTLKERVNLDFAYYWFEFVRPTMIQENRQGVTQVNLNTGIVREMHFPLAPLPEQQRIVAEIEKQFTRLEAGVAALRRVQANLKRYRAAVLKAACEGRLVPTEAELHRQRTGRVPSPGVGGVKAKGKTASTEPVSTNPPFETGEALLARILTERRQNWLARRSPGKGGQGRGQYKEPAAPVTAHLPPFPAGWAVASLEQLTSAARPICYGILMPKENVATGVLFVKVKDMKGDTIDLEGLHRTTPEIAAKYARASLRTGDLLLSIRGTYGRVAEVPKELDGGNITQDTARLDVTSLVNHRYVATCLRNPDCQNHFKRVARGVAVKGVNIGDVRPTPIPLPPLAEQTRIVAEVERRLSVVEELESVVTANLQRASSLRQSILQKAFAGELL